MYKKVKVQDIFQNGCNRFRLIAELTVFKSDIGIEHFKIGNIVPFDISFSV